MIEQRHRGQHARPHGGDARHRRRSLPMPLRSRAARSRRCASVSRSWHQSKTSASWRRSSPREPSAQATALRPDRVVAGHLVVQRLGEAGLRHGRVARHQGRRTAASAWMRARARASAGAAAAGAGTGGDARWRPPPARRTPGRAQRPGGEPPAGPSRPQARHSGPHQSRLCHSDTAPAHPATQLHMSALHKILTSKRLKSIDTWMSDCYLWL